MPSGFPVATTERETPAMRRGKIVREATGNMRVAGVSRHPGAAGRSGWDLRQRIWYGCEWLPPNVLRFSCRRGAAQRVSKCARSRAPKAVSCKRLLAGTLAKRLELQTIDAARVVHHLLDVPSVVQTYRVIPR